MGIPTRIPQQSSLDGDPIASGLSEIRSMYQEFLDQHVRSKAEILEESDYPSDINTVQTFSEQKADHTAHFQDEESMEESYAEKVEEFPFETDSKKQKQAEEETTVVTPPPLPFPEAYQRRTLMAKTYAKFIRALTDMTLALEKLEKFYYVEVKEPGEVVPKKLSEAGIRKAERSELPCSPMHDWTIPFP